MVWCEEEKKIRYKKIYQTFFYFQNISKSKIWETFQICYMKNGYNKWCGGKKSIRKLPQGYIHTELLVATTSGHYVRLKNNGLINDRVQLKIKCSSLYFFILWRPLVSVKCIRTYNI